ncbi:MAG: hypothetical protein K6C34_04085, partial [Alphaproteobacteria bacterium]|nr:hypothetical protein [Alphaproteobacteria bacterium]
APKALPTLKAKTLQTPSSSRANSVAKQTNKTVKNPLDIYEYMGKVALTFNQFAEDFGLKTIANIVNLYLAGNVTLIREGINTAKSEIVGMQTQLNQDLALLQRNNSAIINEFRPLFEELKTLLTQLKISVNAYGRQTSSAPRFSKLKWQIEAVAVKYFDKVMHIGDRLKTEPTSSKSKLKSLENLLVKTVRLAVSLRDLEYLAEQPKSAVFSPKNIMRNERIVKTAISLTDLNSLIKRRIKAIATEAETHIITYSDGKTITEQELLTQARDCIDRACLSDLSALRDKLNLRYTNDQDTESIKRIRLLSNNIVDAQDLLKQAQKVGDTGYYSQFGKMLSDGGMSLIPLVNTFTASIISTDYNDPQARALLSGKQLTGDISQMYVDLLSNGLFSPFSRSILYIVASNAKLSLSSYFSFTGKLASAETSADITQATRTSSETSALPDIATSTDGKSVTPEASAYSNTSTNATDKTIIAQEATSSSDSVTTSSKSATPETSALSSTSTTASTKSATSDEAFESSSNSATTSSESATPETSAYSRASTNAIDKSIKRTPEIVETSSAASADAAITPQRPAPSNALMNSTDKTAEHALETVEYPLAASSKALTTAAEEAEMPTSQTTSRTVRTSTASSIESKLEETATNRKDYNKGVRSSDDEATDESSDRRKVRTRRVGGRIQGLLDIFNKKEKDARDADNLGMTQHGYGKSRLNSQQDDIEQYNRRRYGNSYGSNRAVRAY